MSVYAALRLKRAAALALAAMLVLSATLAHAQAQSRSPSQFIKAMSDDAIAILNAAQLAPAAREARFRALLARDFDLEFIGRFALGPHWRSATPDQQREYRNVFNEYVLRVYSARLYGYAGEALTVKSERVTGDNDIVVDTRMARSGAQPVDLQWRIRARDAEFRVVDVVVGGVSLVVTQRDEFAAVVRRQNVAALIEMLRARAEAPAELSAKEARR